MSYVQGKITDELWEKFRIEAARRFSNKKGFLGKALTEALEIWLQTSKTKPVWDKVK